MEDETGQKPYKRPKTGGRKKGSLNKKTRSTRAFAWATLRELGGGRRLAKLMDKCSPHMQARIFLSLMKMQFGEPKSYVGPEDTTDWGEVLEQSRERVRRAREAQQEPPKAPAPAKPTFKEWARANGLEPPPSPEIPEDPPRRVRRRIVVN